MTFQIPHWPVIGTPLESLNAQRPPMTGRVIQLRVSIHAVVAIEIERAVGIGRCLELKAILLEQAIDFAELCLSGVAQNGY